MIYGSPTFKGLLVAGLVSGVLGLVTSEFMFLVVAFLLVIGAVVLTETATFAGSEPPEVAEPGSSSPDPVEPVGVDAPAGTVAP